MLISDSHRFIFVHIPRTGGTSVKNALNPVSVKCTYARWEKWLTRFGLIRDYRHFRFRTHCTLVDIQRHVPRDIFDAYFKFTIVRHPWSRLKSEYRFLFLGSDLHNNRRRRRHRWIDRVNSFEDFVLQRINHPNAFQFDMVKASSGSLGIDFAGRTEQLQHDFDVICDRLNVQADLAHDNKARTGPGIARPAVDTTSTEVRDFFLEHWRRDLQEFDYREPFPA
ncbi:MAG: sulfotransferase family protein [Gammaproteobacteria bacterium]|nr:sulfotransferase family protein [Gammaproteobacteria bacterium]